MTPSGISERSRARQAAALQKAESISGQSRTKLAAALNHGYDQYSRYVNGVTPLRVEQIEQFAAVYGIDAQALGVAILTGDTSAIEPWDLRAAVRATGEMDEDAIEAFVSTWEGRSVTNQKAAVLDYQPLPASQRQQRDRSA